MTERERKLERLMPILDRHGATRLELTSVENLAWFFGGARVTVPLGGPAVLTATIHRDGSIEVTAFVNEIDRLAEEELGADVELRAAPWFEPLPTGDGLRDLDVVAELRAARASLLPEEVDRFGSLGYDLATATTRALTAARTDEDETALASRIAAGVVAAGAEPVVLLVAGASRLRHRHPLPTRTSLGSRAMVAVGARRNGLVASLTRWLDFDGTGPRDEDLALYEVEADALAATRPCRELREVLADIRHAYERHGFGDDAWLGHHQGGPTGYLGRDPRATPDARDRVAPHQAFAWNPSIPGGKVEDTVVLDGDRVRVLTSDPAWPTTLVRGVPRPLPLTPGS